MLFIGCCDVLMLSLSHALMLFRYKVEKMLASNMEAVYNEDEQQVTVSPGCYYLTNSHLIARYFMSYQLQMPQIINNLGVLVMGNLLFINVTKELSSKALLCLCSALWNHYILIANVHIKFSEFKTIQNSNHNE